MMIQDMRRETIISLLKATHLGRLACAQGSQPYITPFSFVYSENYLYSFTTVGKKLDWMRSNPLVCVECEKIVSPQEWQTVVILGRFQELTTTPEFSEMRVFAHELLTTIKLWWEPGFVKTVHHQVERPLHPVYFRIAIGEMSGHQGVIVSPEV